MQSYAEPARRLADDLAAAAARAPERAIAFQGAPGANSHLAVREHDAAAHPLPCFSFEDALDAVREGRAARALLPIENSLHGRVADIHFLLPESGLAIVDESFLRVRHCLLGAEDGAITQALSHPQALGQCRRWLRARGIRPVAHADTADAAATVAHAPEPGVAAIAPRLAAELYGLSVLAEGIEDEAHNMTRFMVLAAEPTPPPEGVPLMTSLVFAVKNVPAALYKAMGGFATNGVNMTKLESYQRGGSFAATEFYADIAGRPGDANVDRALDELAYHSKWVRLLGTYPQARPRTVD